MNAADRTQKILEAMRIILQAEKEGTMTPAEAMENIFDIIGANHTPEPEPEPPMVAIQSNIQDICWLLAIEMQKAREAARKGLVN